MFHGVIFSCEVTQGLLQILCMHVLGDFPSHLLGYQKDESTVSKQKWPISEPTNPVQCLHNIWIELMIKQFHGLSPSGGLVSPSGGFASLFFDQVEYFASIKLCQALSRQGAIIKIPVVRCHYLLCSSAQLNSQKQAIIQFLSSRTL